MWTHTLFSLYLALAPGWNALAQMQHPFSVDNKVPVQLGVMSRCPDAVLCEKVFNKVLQKVSEKVELSFLYVASINASEPEYGVSCKHGPLECAGNVQQLCVAKYEPFQSLWEFVMCQNSRGTGAIGRFDTAVECGTVAGFDWVDSDAGRCAGEDARGATTEGLGLLKENIKITKALGIEKSCTVVINGRKVCIHDETWQECQGGHSVESFVKQIQDEYEKLNANPGSLLFS